MVQETNNFINGDWDTLLFMGLSYLLGSLITTLISHFLTKDKDRQFNRAVALYEAAKRFRESLHDALLEINRGREHAYAIIQNYYDIHTLYAWEFECVLSSKLESKKVFRVAWEQYQKYCDTHGNENIKVTDLPETPNKKILTDFENHIKNLIELTVNS